MLKAPLTSAGLKQLLSQLQAPLNVQSLTQMIKSPLTSAGVKAQFIGSASSDVPTSISSCVLWLDAADTSKITASGGVVSSWQDKSGNSNHASGANGPLSGNSTISGKNVLTFDGSNDQLSIPTIIPAPQTTGFTVFVVAFPTNPIVGTRGFLDGGAAAGQRVYMRVQTGQVIAAIGNQGVATITVNGTTSAPFVSDVRHVPVSGATTLAVNGTTSSVFNPLFTGSVGAMALGVQTTASTPFFAGHIAECVIYNRALSDSERLTIRQYLATKWGITIA